MYLGDGLEIGKINLLGKRYFSGIERESWNMREGKEGKVRQVGKDIQDIKLLGK